MHASNAVQRLGFVPETSTKGIRGYAKTVLGRYRVFALPMHHEDIETWRQSVRCVFLWS